MPSADVSFDTLRAAMLPLDGAIGEWVPRIVDAAESVIPGRVEDMIFADLTAGSCLMALYFGARGVRRLTLNDTAARTLIAAQALFGSAPIDWGQVERLVGGAQPRLHPHVPSFHFACDYLLAPAADVFDRLFHAVLPDGRAAPYRYLALRWVMSFAMDADHSFPVLLTHDPDQLREEEGDWWPDYLAQTQDPLPILKTLTHDINAGIERQRTGEVELRQGDLLTEVDRLALGRDCLMAVNPPTNGLDEYVIDDQLVHSLIANRWLPLSKSRENAAEFWERRVRKALGALKTGGHAFVWGGDGALSHEECRRIWLDYGTLAHAERVSRNRKSAGWAILRRR